MKILIATGLYPPDIGGPATYTKMLEEHLPQHGIIPMVVPYGSVRRYPRIIRHLVYAWKLIRESKGCSLMYALDPISVGLPALFASVLTRKPLFLRIAGDYAWEQGQQRFGVTDTLDDFVKKRSQRHFFVSVLAWLEWLVARSARVVIVPSNYMRGIVHAWGVDKDRIRTIYSALHPLTVSETKEELRDVLSYSGVVLVTAGRLVPWKGMEMLIALLPSLRDELGEVSLVIIGDGPLMETLKNRSHAEGVTEYVRFVGSMPKDALGAAIKGADVFVLNTAYEGMSHQLIEVMDLGVPVVTTDVGGNPELITPGVNGVLVHFNDAKSLMGAIVEVARDVALQEKLIENAKVRSRDFGKQKVIGELATVLTQYE